MMLDKFLVVEMVQLLLLLVEYMLLVSRMVIDKLLVVEMVQLLLLLEGLKSTPKNNSL